MLTSGAALFANGFIPWWYRVVTPERTYSYNAGLTGWGTVAVASGAVAALAVLLRAALWPEPAHPRDAVLYAALGALALVALGVQLLRTDADWIGVYVAITLAIALIVGGIRRRAERRAGWM